jgi:hypothetical protein
VRQLAFYCVCDRAHFLGLVALVNSLRVLGHDERVYVLDCGLEAWQSDVLAQDENVVVVADETSLHPMLLKAVLPLAHPARVMVVVDVDIVFTARLDDLVREAVESGKPMLFPDSWPDRFEPSWERLGFGAPVPHPYVASGQFVLHAETGREFLAIWEQGLQRLAADPELAGADLPPEENPFRFPDMDVLNALIGPAIPLDSFVLADGDSAAYPPFDGVRIVDSATLAVEGPGGSRPVILHHFLGKPWNSLVAPSVYSRLMTRLLYGADVALKVEPSRIAPALRRGATGVAARRYVVTRLWVRRTRRLFRERAGRARQQRQIRLGDRSSPQES